jgi:hypothetical protein
VKDGLITVRTSRLTCKRAGKTRIFPPVIRGNPWLSSPRKK